MREILIHCDKENTKTIALIENGKLLEKYEENEIQKRLEGNIYFGIVKDVLPGMQAAFINIGEDKNTFIHIKDIIPKVSNETGNKNEELSKHDIKKYIRVGQPLMVQVKKDSTMKKGARVSTHISIPGRFIVLMPNNDFITVSQKIDNKTERDRLINIVKQSKIGKNGVIIRTSAKNKDENLIKKDIEYVILKWNNIQQKEKGFIKKQQLEPQKVYENADIVQRFLNDIIDQDIDKIITNQELIYKNVYKFLEETGYNRKITLEYKKEYILQYYDIREQIEELKRRKIWLKCGGFITIDKTEALTAIDVNSGKYTGKQSLEQTILTVNKEATIEIAKQLRLRDIGGIIIIDYIDMEKDENKNQIISLLQDQLKKDRSKTQVVGFTKLNLVEMTRKHVCSN